MSSLTDALKALITGVKSNETDQQIDQAFDQIKIHSLSGDKNNFIEMMKSVFNQVGIGDLGLNNAETFSGTSSTIQNFDNSGRLTRYNEYDAIINKISYCMRALETLTDHVISPDDISKTSLQYVVDEDVTQTEQTKTAITRLKAIEKKLKLEDRIRKIVRTTLLKGDCFLELVISKNGSNLLRVLNENSCLNDIDLQSFPVKVKYSLDKNNIDSEGKIYTESVEKTNTVIIEYTNSFSMLDGNYFTPASASTSIPTTTYISDPTKIISKDSHEPLKGTIDNKKVDQNAFKSNFDKPEEKQKDNELLLSNIFMVIHNPKYIVRLETERFKTCLGYLVFPKVDIKALMATGGFNATNVNSVDGICNTILNRISKKLSSNTNDKIHVSSDIKNAILAQLAAIKNNEDLKIRFVPEKQMIHWRLNPDKFDPYGESIFECVNFNCRLLMALETATTIKRLTHSTDKRVINVETGLPRDAQNIINALKESLNKRKMSINNMGSIDSIPSQIQTFETIFVPMRDNKKFVEFDKMEWGMNPQEDIEPLKFMRDSIVAALGVPAPYLGLEENTSNRSLLTVENINFTRTIIALQKSLTPYLVETLAKAYHILYHDVGDSSILETIIISFQEPRTSPYEHQMEYIQQAQTAIDTLSNLGISKTYLKKKYLPHFDWDKIESETSMDNLNKELGEEQDNGMLMSPGMMGGGMM